MQKKDLIQRAAVAFAAAHVARGERADMDKVIGWAEALWERLTSRGYGAPEPTGPRDGIDWYSKLQGAGRQWFDEFWEAFKLKKGRNNAAKRWYQLGDINKGMAHTIIEAARRESARQLEPGQARKMAEGWLAERRWQDHQAPAEKTVRPEARQTGRLREIAAEIQHFQALADADPSGVMAKKLEALRAEKATIEGEERERTAPNVPPRVHSGTGAVNGWAGAHPGSRAAQDCVAPRAGQDQAAKDGSQPR